jgi:hypothetical protein
VIKGILEIHFHPRMQGPKPILFVSAAAALKKWPSAASAALGSRRFFLLGGGGWRGGANRLERKQTQDFKCSWYNMHIICTFQLFSQLYNKCYKIFDVISAWERQTILPSRSECTRSYRVLCGAGQL